MKLNNTQLELIILITQKNEVSIKEITDSLHISNSLTYLYVNELVEKGFLLKRGQRIILSTHIFSRILSNLLMEDNSLIEVLANEGIPILIALMNVENKNLKDISKEVGIGVSSIYPYFRRFLKRQIIIKHDRYYKINSELWKKLFDFIGFYKNHSILIQFNKVPTNAKIYFESLYLIIFSLTNEINFAPKTAFSEYDKFGVKLRENEVFYRIDHLPKRKLDIQTIFLDSLRIAGTKNEESSRRRLYCYLFYRKNINHLRKIRHPDLDIVKGIVDDELDSKEYQNFPTREEIIQKGQDYDIRI
jgi:predicted transcriptional regulator